MIKRWTRTNIDISLFNIILKSMKIQCFFNEYSMFVHNLKQWIFINLWISLNNEISLFRKKQWNIIVCPGSSFYHRFKLVKIKQWKFIVCLVVDVGLPVDTFPLEGCEYVTKLFISFSCCIINVFSICFLTRILSRDRWKCSLVSRLDQ